MDIAQLAVADTAVLHLKNASGEFLFADKERTKPVEIVLYGPGSKQYAAVEDRQTTRSVQRNMKNEGKYSPISPEDRLKEIAEDLADITVEFRNLTYSPAGQAVGAELFKAVYGDQKLGFILKQVNRFVDDWGNFKPAGAGH